MTTSEKTCFKCGATKPLTEFYKHPMMLDGRLNKCKECTKKDVKANRLKRLDYYRKYDTDRYRNDPVRRKETIARFRRKVEKYPAMQVASNLVSNAIRDGYLISQPCEVCGEERSEAHHPDYSKPYEVMWLCRSHHVQWHHDNGPGKNADIAIEKMDMNKPEKAA